MKLKQNLFNNDNYLPRIAGHQAISKPDKFTNSVSSFIIWSGSFHTVGKFPKGNDTHTDILNLSAHAPTQTRCDVQSL